MTKPRVNDSPMQRRGFTLIETVVTVVPDLYGRLVGKRITGRFFLDETADHGMHMCDYLLACDMEIDPVQGYAFTDAQSRLAHALETSAGSR